MKNKIEIEKVDNLFIDYEKFKASFAQSKQNGLIYFEVSVPASTLEDLEDVGRKAIQICVGLCNEFNGRHIKKTKNKDAEILTAQNKKLIKDNKDLKKKLKSLKVG